MVFNRANAVWLKVFAAVIIDNKGNCIEFNTLKQIIINNALSDSPYNRRELYTTENPKKFDSSVNSVGRFFRCKWETRKNKNKR